MSSRLSIWAPLPPTVHARPAVAQLPFPLAEPGCALFARARHGLWQGVQALGLAPGDEVLVPAYHHGSEVQALLDAGLVPRFYAGTESLAPDGDELDALLSQRVRALYVIDYLGFPQDTARWRAWCDERGLLLIEDAAQAWLSASRGRPAGALADLAVYCLYKTIGVPDGAAMLVRTAPPGPEVAAASGLRGLVRRHALWALGRSRTLGALAPSLPASRPYDPADDFALGDPAAPPSAATARLLPRLADGTVAARRRANYSVLLGELGHHVPAPFGELTPGASPFAFPIEVDDKAGALAQFARAGIAAFDLWSTPHPAVPDSAFPAVDGRRARTVVLPCHQELRSEDLERIAAATPAPRRRRRDLGVEFTTSFDDLRDDWSELAEHTGNVFASWEWNETWWRHFGAGRRPLLGVCRAANGRVAGILPLYSLSSGPLSLVRFIGHGPADHLGPVCDERDRPAVAYALRQALARLRPDLFVGERLSSEEGWSALVGGRVVRREGSPVLRFADGISSWDDYLATRSSNLRQQLRRFERKGAALGLAFRAGGDALDDDYDTLFRLHEQHWPDSDFAGRHAAFHREFARIARERGWLRLWLLERDGEALAAWQGFRFAGVESYYQAGRLSDWEGPPIGLLVLAHSIRAALEDDVREYRFLRGSEPFKYRFATEDAGIETVVRGRGALGSAAEVATATIPEPLALSLRRRLAA